MGGDDRQSREVGGHAVDEDRSAVLEPEAETAGCACPDAGRAHVEEADQAEALGCLVDRVVALLAGRETLHSLLELEAAQAKLMAALDLIDAPAHLLVRIDRAETQEDVRVVPDGQRNGVIGDCGKTGVGARVLTEEHGHHLPRAVHLGGLGQGHLVDHATLELPLRPLQVGAA